MKINLNKIFFLLFLFTCILFSACKKKIPANVIPPGKMEHLLYDYHLAKAMADDLPSDERYKQGLYLDYVFKKYNTTEEIFDSSMVWYTRHTGELNKIYENVNKRFKKDQEILDNLIAKRENKPLTSMPGDSVEIWYQHRIRKLLPYPLVNKMEFTIPVDSNYKQRDLFVWKINYSFLPAIGDTFMTDSVVAIRDSAIMALSIKLSNDSIISEYRKINFSGMDSLILTSDSLYDLKELRGFVYYPGKDISKELLLSQISLMRYHRYLNDSIDVNSADTLSVGSSVEEEKDKDQKQPQRVTPDDVLISQRDSLQSAPVRRSPREIREESRRANKIE